MEANPDRERKRERERVEEANHTSFEKTQSVPSTMVVAVRRARLSK